VPNLTTVIPTSLANILQDAFVTRASSFDSVVTAALSQYFQSPRHRAYQISTSAALVQGVHDGAVSSRTPHANGDFGLGTFEHLDGEMVVLDGNIYQVRGDGTVQRLQCYHAARATRSCRIAWCSNLSSLNGGRSRRVPPFAVCLRSRSLLELGWPSGTRLPE
jgi:hypothetical protein